MRVAELMDKMDMEPLNQVFDKEIAGGLVTDMVSDVMKSGEAGNIWVTVQTHKKVIAAANLVDIAAVVITQGKKVEDDVLKAADKAEITIFSTPLPAFSFVGKIYALGIRITPYRGDVSVA